MKLAVIGQSVEDYISEGNISQHKPGGIFYSAAALVNIAEPDDDIYLFTSMEKEKFFLFSKVYSHFDQSLFTVDENIPVVHLTIHSDKERDELYENMNNPLNINREKIFDADGMYVNMVTGNDITLNILKELREKFKGPVYLDIHTLSRSYDSSGKRIFRKIPDAADWISCADFLQVNESELFTLSTKQDEHEIVKEVLDNRVKYLLITKGNKGVRMFYKEKNEIFSVFMSAIKINTLNKVGCGDVFGAVYIYYYIKNNNVFDSLRKANTAAGLTASYGSLEEFSSLKDDVLARHN